VLIDIPETKKFVLPNLLNNIIIVPSHLDEYDNESMFAIGHQYEYSYFSTRWSWDILYNIINQNSLPYPKSIKFEKYSTFSQTYDKNPEMFENSQIEILLKDRDIAEYPIDEIIKKMKKCNIYSSQLLPFKNEILKPINDYLIDSVKSLTCHNFSDFSEIKNIFDKQISLKFSSLKIHANDLKLTNNNPYFQLELPKQLTNLQIILDSTLRGPDIKLDLSPLSNLKTLEFYSLNTRIMRLPPTLTSLNIFGSVDYTILITCCPTLKKLKCDNIFNLDYNLDNEIFDLEVDVDSFFRLTNRPKTPIENENHTKKIIVEPNRCFKLVNNVHYLSLHDDPMRSPYASELFGHESNDNLKNLKTFSINGKREHTFSHFPLALTSVTIDVPMPNSTRVICLPENVNYFRIAKGNQINKIKIEGQNLKYLRLQNFKFNILEKSSLIIPQSLIELGLEFCNITNFHEWEFPHKIKILKLTGNKIRIIPKLPPNLNTLACDISNLIKTMYHFPLTLNNLKIAFGKDFFWGGNYDCGIKNCLNLDFFSIGAYDSPVSDFRLRLDLLPSSISCLQLRTSSLIVSGTFDSLENLQKLEITSETFTKYLETYNDHLFGPKIESICYYGSQIDKQLLSKAESYLKGDSNANKITHSLVQSL
ncbi:hypothetical protein G210_3165, partial [Candida maltosa Xu316]